MKHVKSFDTFITEKKGDSYGSGCVMLYFDFPQLEEIHGKIAEEDIFTQEGDRTFGLEDEPHVTLLYGLEDSVTLNEVKEIIAKYEFTECTLHNASLFENEYDVFKFDVKGDNLHDCNASLRELPYSNSYPDYHPHVTIAYLKEGEGAKYCKQLEGVEYKLKPKYAVYSQADGTKDNIEI